MNQSKIESHIEALVNIGSGFILSFLVWLYIVSPLIRVEVLNYNSPTDGLYITLIFTITSYIRSYFWRRFFNKGIHKMVHNFIFNKKERNV